MELKCISEIYSTVTAAARMRKTPPVATWKSGDLCSFSEKITAGSESPAGGAGVWKGTTNNRLWRRRASFSGPGGAEFTGGRGLGLRFPTTRTCGRASLRSHCPAGSFIFLFPCVLSGQIPRGFSVFSRIIRLRGLSLSIISEDLRERAGEVGHGSVASSLVSAVGASGTFYAPGKVSLLSSSSSSSASSLQLHAPFPRFRSSAQERTTSRRVPPTETGSSRSPSWAAEELSGEIPRRRDLVFLIGETMWSKSVRPNTRQVWRAPKPLSELVVLSKPWHRRLLQRSAALSAIESEFPKLIAPPFDLLWCPARVTEGIAQK